MYFKAAAVKFSFKIHRRQFSISVLIFCYVAVHTFGWQNGLNIEELFNIH